MHNKKKILIVFPHSPNPRMIKRVRALLTKYEVHVIYWDRGLDYKKKNELPSGSKVTVIEKKANEGEPLKRLGVTISVIKEVVSLAKKNHLIYCIYLKQICYFQVLYTKKCLAGIVK